MTDLPKLSIGLVTFRRTNEAIRTIQSTSKNLIYPKELRSWYIGDDGSPAQHHFEVMSAFAETGENFLGDHNDRMRHTGSENTHNAGLGWNKTLGICHQNSDFVLWLEDDWVLEQPLDLERYVRLLMNREDVGVVSFRILSVGTDVQTVGHDGEVYIKYLRSTQYAYSGNPHLRHARFTKSYGWFAEDRNPGNMELGVDDQYRTLDGPDIWRPLTISPWGGWAHIGTDKSWS